MTAAEQPQKQTKRSWRSAIGSRWWRGQAGWRRGLSQLFWCVVRLALGQWLWGTGLRLIFFPEPTRYLGLVVALIAAVLVLWAGAALVRAVVALGIARLIVLMLALFVTWVASDLVVAGEQITPATIWERAVARGSEMGARIGDGIKALIAAPGDVSFAYTGRREPPALPPGFPTPDPLATPVRAVAWRAGEGPPPPPVFQPTPSGAMSSDTASGLRVGGFARVANVGDEPLRARAAPGTDAPIMVRFPEGTRVQIVAGPVEASGFRWWRVRSERGQEGWCADRWLQPAE